MIIKVNYNDEEEIKDIKTVDELKDELLEFAGYFIPEDDIDAFNYLERNMFDDVISDIEDYYVESYFNIAKEFFLTLKRIYAYNSFDEIISEFNNLNEIFNKSGINLKYSV